MQKIVLTGWILIVTLVLAGCSSRTVSESFVREEVDFAFVQKIAVLPFENNSDDEYAPERARDITITQVLAYGLFDTVEKGLVDSVLYEEALEPGTPLDPLTLKRLGQRLKVQAFIIGTVDLAGTGKVGPSSYPEMALTLRLIEANSGMILWQASGNYSGESTSGRLFGLKPDDQYQITIKLVRKLLRTAPAGGY
jgi:TolB-like protein